MYLHVAITMNPKHQFENNSVLIYRIYIWICIHIQVSVCFVYESESGFILLIYALITHEQPCLFSLPWKLRFGDSLSAPFV